MFRARPTGVEPVSDQLVLASGTRPPIGAGLMQAALSLSTPRFRFRQSLALSCGVFCDAVFADLRVVTIGGHQSPHVESHSG